LKSRSDQPITPAVKWLALLLLLGLALSASAQKLGNRDFTGEARAQSVEPCITLNDLKRLCGREGADWCENRREEVEARSPKAAANDLCATLVRWSHDSDWSYTRQ
jgi:hypothetical protein